MAELHLGLELSGTRSEIVLLMVELHEQINCLNKGKSFISFRSGL